MSIKDLSVNDVLNDADRIPIWDSENGRTRSVLAETILKYIDDHPSSDKFVQSGSYSQGVLTLVYNDGGHITINGFEMGTVTSVNTKTGDVVLTSQDINAEPLRASGTIGFSQDPTTMAQGDYYVTEKFLNSPDLPQGVSYVGLVRIDVDFDGSDNGGLIQYYSDNGIYLKKKLASGWEASWEDPLKHGLQSYQIIATTTDPYIGINSQVTLTTGNPYPSDAIIPSGTTFEFSYPEDAANFATISGNVITFHAIGRVSVTARTPEGLTSSLDVISITAPLLSYDFKPYQSTQFGGASHNSQESQLMVGEYATFDVLNVNPSNADASGMYYYLLSQDPGVIDNSLGEIISGHFQVTGVGNFSVKAWKRGYEDIAVTKQFTTVPAAAPPFPPSQPIRYRAIANFESQLTQEPTGLGDSNKIKLTFGGGGTSTDGLLTMASTGITTFHKGGFQYAIRLAVRLGRSNATGESIIGIRFMYAADGVEGNAVQIGPTLITMIDNQKSIWPEIFYFNFDPAEGSILWAEIGRDESGDNSGGVLTVQPTGSMSSWEESNSCSVYFEALEVV